MSENNGICDVEAIKKFNYPNSGTLNLTEEQSILAGSRYNRGIKRNKADFIRSIAAPPVFKREDYPSGYNLRDYTLI